MAERLYFKEHVKPVARLYKMEEVVFLHSQYNGGDYTQTKLLKDFLEKANKIWEMKKSSTNGVESLRFWQVTEDG